MLGSIEYKNTFTFQRVPLTETSPNTWLFCVYIDTPFPPCAPESNIYLRVCSVIWIGQKCIRNPTDNPFVQTAGVPIHWSRKNIFLTL